MDSPAAPPRCNTSKNPHEVSKDTMNMRTVSLARVALLAGLLLVGDAWGQEVRRRPVGRQPRPTNPPTSPTPQPTPPPANPPPVVNPAPINRPPTANPPVTNPPVVNPPTGNNRPAVVRPPVDNRPERPTQLPGGGNLSPINNFDRPVTRPGFGARPVERGIRARGFVPRGTRVARLPNLAERILISAVEYFRAGDVYYRPIGAGSAVNYEVCHPPLGAYLGSLPGGCTTVLLGGVSYYCYDDVYYLPSVQNGRLAYLVVEPPLGATISVLPAGHEFITHQGQRICRVGNLYYRPIYQGQRLVYVRIPPIIVQPTILFGSLSYRGRLALPSDNCATVQLIDLNAGGAVVGEQRIIGGQSPIPFQIDCGPRLAPGSALGLTAHIATGSGRLMYATVQPFRVGAASDRRPIDLLLEPASGAVAAPLPIARLAGRLFYRERIALPQNAEVLVRIVDSGADRGGPAIVAEQRFLTNGRQVPIPFVLDYNPAQVDPFGFYTLEARVFVNGQTLFYNAFNDRVITDGYPDENVEVELVNAR